MVRSEMVVHSDIPGEMTIAEWKESRATPKPPGRLRAFFARMVKRDSL